jgi:hypothetical protein
MPNPDPSSKESFLKLVAALDKACEYDAYYGDNPVPEYRQAHEKARAALDTAIEALFTMKPDETTMRIDPDMAFEAGWRAAAEWAHRDDLLADIGSAAYNADMTARLRKISAVETSGIHPLPCPMCKQRHAPWCPGKSPEKASGEQS